MALKMKVFAAPFLQLGLMYSEANCTAERAKIYKYIYYSEFHNVQSGYLFNQNEQVCLRLEASRNSSII